MQVVHERCAGLDVHKKTVVASVLSPEGQETRTFGTMTRDLLLLADWLTERGVTHVAMESTGVYWKPVYNLLEDQFTLLVVNAHHIKAVPGRKTDVKDAEWIADLLRHGLVRGSFIPSRPQRELRELTRARRSLIQQRSQVANRIQKVLEGANIKLASVATDVVGVSGRAMLEAMVAGTEDPQVLAEMARGTLRKKTQALEDALEGLVGPHQRLLLGTHLRHLDFLDGEIARLDEEVAARLRPFEQVLERVDAIAGIGRRVAEDVLAEIGTDMSRFPTAAHLASWARVCPGNNESAGKRKSGSTGHGNSWLRPILVQAAQSASRTKGTYLAAQYHRIAARRGRNRAIMAVAHTILVTIYYMLTRGTVYSDLGGNYFDERDRQATIRRAVRRIEGLGYTVTLEAA
ncbi:MAG TPA: IS110 family transposase [Dehalococcoidia bacterium]|nr:IS110 family transposase [Dehalococcoidia bacterium]